MQSDTSQANKFQSGKSQSGKAGPLSVSEVNQSVSRLLETHFGQIWVEGEISNLARPKSGHLYFSLKDAQSQIRCAMFRNSQFNLQRQKTRSDLADGTKVITRGRLSLYRPRGDYQLIVESMELAGEGALRQAFEALKLKLSEEGLFAEEHKKPLPAFPETLGVVTSASGAALQDILMVLNRRFPGIKVKVFATQVQGQTAAREIIKALAKADKDPTLDVIILGRGGGSLEDLYCFNDEALARAIFKTKHPIISAVGHETDICISDLVADVRAPTPSAAAELASPDQQEVIALIQGYRVSLSTHMNRYLRFSQMQLKALSKGLRHPKQQLEEFTQRLDQIESRLAFATQQQLQWIKGHYTQVKLRLYGQNLTGKFQTQSQQIEKHKSTLERCINALVTHQSLNLVRFLERLDNLSPTNTLKRGYALALKSNTQETLEEHPNRVVDINASQKLTLIQSVKQVSTGETLQLFLQDGRVSSKVTQVQKSDTASTATPNGN